MVLCGECVRSTQLLLHRASIGHTCHFPFPKILTSAPDCDFCHLLKESGIRRFKTLKEKSLNGEALLDYMKARLSNEPLFLSLNGVNLSSQIADQFMIWSSSAELGWSVEVWAEAGSSSARKGRINSAPPIRQDDSEESYDMIRTWLSKCRTNHKRCSTTISNHLVDEDLIQLPIRVIDVSPDQDPGQVVLIKSHGKRGHYAALSHCWGPPSKKPLQTTKETLSQHERGIRIERLPKTFRDAVMVTREIGIRFLWIDSLCIVQQDKAEWNHEVLRMGEIFENAQVVIAATTARDSSEGLFMSGRHLTDPIVKLPYDRDGEVMASFSAPLKPHHEGECLWSRAWTFQERHFARRMLIFGLKGILWTCKSTERDGENIVLSERGAPHRRWDPLDTKWLDHVEEYSHMDLTYEDDRLAAIEGLGRELEKARSDTYKAGIWSSEAHESLFWIVDRPSQGVSSGRRVPGIPSWSWASVTGSKQFPRNYRRKAHLTPTRTKTTRINNSGSSKRDLLAGITFNSGNDLSIKSHLKQASLSPGCRCLSNTNESLYKPSDGHNESECIQNSSPRDDFYIFSNRETQALKMKDSNSEPVGWAYFDEKSVEDFLCLLLYEIEGGIDLFKHVRGQKNSHGVISLYGIALLLEQVPGTESFRRVGLGLITMSNWFDGEPLLSISVV